MNAARRLRQWTTHYPAHGALPQTSQGKHRKTKSLIEDLSVRTELLEYLNAQPINSITADSFAKHVSEKYGKITPRSARRWMDRLGWVYDEAKGTYLDGHERDDVVKYRAEFLARMADSGASRLGAPGV